MPLSKPVPLEPLAAEFFREFARPEYCLKAVGLRKGGKVAEADWRLYANEPEILELFQAHPSPDFTAALNYYRDKPPKKQVVIENNLEWEATLPDHKNDSELVLQLICRVRNNLFHGGKFNGHWFEPQRSFELLTHGLLILSACSQSHSAVREAYAGNTT